MHLLHVCCYLLQRDSRRGSVHAPRKHSVISFVLALPFTGVQRATSVHVYLTKFTGVNKRD